MLSCKAVDIPKDVNQGKDWSAEMLVESTVSVVEFESRGHGFDHLCRRFA